MTAPLITTPGMFPDILPPDYFAEPCPAPALTASIGSILLNECPAKAAYAHPAIDQPAEDRARELERYIVGSGVGTAAQSLGGVVHRLSLGKGADYVISPYDEYRTKEAREWRDEQSALGNIAIKQKHFDECEAMASVMRHAIEDAVHGHEYQTELVIAWQESNGVWCRGMLDVYVPALNLIFDVKTAASVSDGAIDTTFNRYGYARQSAFYRRGIDAITGDAGGSRFDFLFIETKAPWLSRTVDTSEGFRAGATVEIERNIETWGACLASGEWPGYGKKTVAPRPWKVKEWLESGIDVDVEE